MKINVKGPSRTFDLKPLWEARVEVVKLNQPKDHRAIRNLFISRGAPIVNGIPLNVGGNPLLPPGTMLALCRVETVKIRLGNNDYGWTDHGKSLANPSLLLLQAPPEAWRAVGTQLQFPDCVCIGGEIALDLLDPNDNQGNWRQHFPNLATADHIILHGSGFSLAGETTLAWDDTPLAGLFHVMLPFPEVPGVLRMTLDRERMSAAMLNKFAAAFQRLAEDLLPVVPERPNWVGLELSQNAAVPKFHWELTPLTNGALFKLERDEAQLLLSDQALGTEGVLPRSLSRSVPAEVAITRQGNNQLQLKLNSGAPPAGSAGKFVYAANRSGGSWSETVTVTDIAAGYDPLAVAGQLRLRDGLAEPDPLVKISPAVLWGFAPLEDGWAQLPFLNLTEQIYLDVFNPKQEEESEPLLLGAVSIGNDSPELGSLKPGEQSWSVTLLDASHYEGTWMLNRAAGETRWKPQTISLTINDPELALNGFLWLATEAASIADALPSLDNFLAGLQMVSLRSLRPQEMFPPPFLLNFSKVIFGNSQPGAASNLSYPQLQAWEYRYEANQRLHQGQAGLPVFDKLLEKPMWEDANIFRDLPLIWRRHPNLPAIQSLPLTQNQSPPNYPSPSRQLAPFELPIRTTGGVIVPGEWRFGVGAAGAAEWPRMLNPQVAPPAREWKNADGLWLAALSVPGLVFDANSDGALTSPASQYLPVQYKFGLPATDELNALAQLPKENKLDKAANSEAPAEPPRLPLVREGFQRHWSVLSEKAFLARHDADDALAGNGAATAVRNLIEPFDWPVSATLSETEYPGSLTLEENGQKLELKAASALRGIEGKFTETGGKLKLDAGDSPEFSVVAGSMQMQTANGRARDQRGLHRNATEPAAPDSPGKLLKTRVQLEGKPEITLCSLLEPLELKVGDGVWQLWFRGAPLQGTVFDRSLTRSDYARGVNDPAANSREFAHLSGYEWRLAETQSTHGLMRLNAFEFYPLTLEEVELANDAVSAVEITGRLQLPAAAPAEQVDLNNAVRIRFELETGALKLATIQAAAPEPDRDSIEAVPAIPVEWPLAENEFAPVLSWQTISYNAANGEITLADARLSFSLFGARWELPPKPLVFPAAASTATLSYAAAELEAPVEAAISIKEIKLTLALDDPKKNDLAVSLNFRWGSAEQMNLQAAATVHLLGEKSGEKEFSASLVHSADQLAVESSGATLSLLPMAIQLPFKVSTPASQANQQLLPGMHLSSVEAVNGFAVMSVAVAEGDGGTPKLPTLRVRAAFMEAILPCEWGLQLQEARLGQNQNAGQETERVFGSSAGRLYAGFALRHARGNNGQPAWNPSLLLNGFLEIKNLISWPSQLVEDSTTLKLPAVRPDGDDPPLDHLRHSMRMLFNQHEAPMKALKAGAGDLLFDFAEGKSWQFLAIVEHQLIEVETGAPGQPLSVAALRNDRRWTATQEVRLMRPEKFSALLNSFQQKKFVTFDGSRDLAATSLTLANQGVHREELINRLLNGPRGDEFARLQQTLLVEASAPHWVRVKENTAGQFTNLQYLPRGTQRAIISTPEDFASRDAAEKAWLLLSLPVIGRLQAQKKDKLAAAPISNDDSLLQLDPIVYLHRQRLAGPQAKFEAVPLALASWEETEDRMFSVSEFDLAQRRLFGSLDPATLAESWYRLQNPPVETAAGQLPSVLAALPTDSPGRLSRQAMLRRLTDAYRQGLPPCDPKDTNPPAEEVGADQELVWRRDSLFVLQAVGKDLNKFHYSFALAGAQFLTAPFVVAEERTTRHSTATLLPASLRVLSQQNPQPVSFAVSPYLSLDYAELSGQNNSTKLRLTVGELLCLDPSGADLGSVASQVWAEETGTVEAIENWGREVHDRLAVDSPVAVVRARKVKEFGGTANVAVEYEFHVLTVQPPVSPARRSKRVRVRLEGLRFVEGQFGGNVLPEQVANFELSSPQLRGVQPIYLDDRPGNADPANRQWNWGLSALRLGIQQIEGQAGLAGKIPAFPSKTTFRLWWQANRHEVQFALPSRESARRSLPRRFRSRAIKSLLPALPNVPLPSGTSLKLADASAPSQLDARLLTWQPMMPGSFRSLILGARAGAPFLFNQHLLCQQTGGDEHDMVFASSSTPVQHRMPRPVALPPNRNGFEEVALQTWESYFAPKSNSLVTSDPVDNAFISASQKLGLEMRLAEPSAGVIQQGGGNDLFFELKTASGKDALTEWDIGLELVLESRRIVYALNAAQPKTGGLVRFSTTNADAGKLIGGLAHGAEVYAEAKIKPKQEGKVKNYRQTLRFPLRFARAGEARLPLRPVFTQFEDPEYNRRLASVTARSTAAASIKEKRYEITLSADRCEYNANSQMFVVFFGDAIPNLNISKLKLERVDSGGVKRLIEDAAQMKLGELRVFDLGKLAEERGFAFSTGDTLLMTLTLTDDASNTLELSLGVQIVARPVVPTPGAGYALLRRMKLAQTDVVECARFAWAPQASRIELINPDDLTGEIVRRRAVFQWLTTARVERPSAFEVQKIAFSGSTHFPALELDSGE